MPKLKGKRCLLKSVNETHPHIEITEENTFVGRSRESQIADTLVSKKHLKLRADFDKKCVIIELLGLNPSTVNGEVIEKNREHEVFDGDVIEIIPSKYSYKVHFEVDELTQQKLTCEETIGQKRKRSSDEPSTDLPSKKRMKWTISVVLDAKNHAPGLPWESYNNGQLFVYTPSDCKPSNKIGSYDMDGTLITTQSGKVFPTNVDDWKLAFGTVVTTLKSKHSDGYKIVIFTNQAGVTSGKTKVVDIKKKIENVIRALGIPVQAFVATGDNCFRKPLTGMWQTLCDHKNDGISIDTNKSYFVGDAAGRPENKALKKKKDHSSVDRLMALNIGLEFFTPEEHFLKASRQNWVKPEFIPKEFLSRSIELIQNPKQSITSNKLEIILMVGGPGTGNSLLLRFDFIHSSIGNMTHFF